MMVLGGWVILFGNSDMMFYDMVDVKLGGEFCVFVGSVVVFFG